MREKLPASRIDICAVRSLGEGTVELEDGVFRSPLPPLDGFAGDSDDIGCRIRRILLIAESSDGNFLFQDRALNFEDVDAIFETRPLKEIRDAKAECVHLD